jgi:hypothetical protein
MFPNRNAGRQAELGAHFFQAAHEEGALVHPLLDRAEGMLDGLATPIENLGSHAKTIAEQAADDAKQIAYVRRHFWRASAFGSQLASISQCGAGRTR